MKTKPFILAGLVLLVVLGFFQTRAGVPIVQAQIFSTSNNGVYLPLVLRSGTAATPTFTPTSSPTIIPTATSTPTDPAISPLYRFGVALTRRPFTDYGPFDIASMRFGWYVDYRVTADATTPYGMEYVPTVRVKQLKWSEDGTTKLTCRRGDYYVDPAEYIVEPGISQIQSIAANRPGMTWLIGNEIERRDWDTGTCGHQDEITPELYAVAYHDIYTAIKAVDPTARVANGSLVEFTPLRQEYLNRIWAEYLRLYHTSMPVDVWNIHLFVLREIRFNWGADVPAGLNAASGMQYSMTDNKDFTKVWAQVLALRTWMKDHGQKDKPLIVTEYGVNYPDWYLCAAYPDTTGCPLTQEEVRDRMMYPSFDAFLNQTDASLGDSEDGNHLIQRWNWWSADFDDGDCDNGVFYALYGGSLFNSGLGPSKPPMDCAFPAQGIAKLGSYWKQYVQALP